MTAWPSIYVSNAVVSATLVTVAETIIATIPVTTDGPVPILIMGFVDITSGAGGTGLILRFRTDSVAGGVIRATSTIPLAASTVGVFNPFVVWSPSETAARNVHLTAQQVGSSGNAAINAVSLAAIPQY